MFFRVSKARGKFQRIQFDKNGALVPAIDYRLRKSEQADPAFGYSHSPEMTFHLKEFQHGQYARRVEGGLFDIHKDGQLWSPFSPIFVADNANFSASTQPLSPDGWFGDGSDGTLTLDGVQGATGFMSADSPTQYSLLRDCFFAALTINAGITLKPNGYRLFVKGILTNNGIITGSGGAGGNGTAGGDGDLLTANGSKGGPGGASGDNVPDGSIGAGSPYTTISNAAIQNPSLLWITTAHDFGGGESRRIVVSGIVGITGATGTFLASRVDGTRLALSGSFTGSYTSGGQWYNHVHGGQGGTGQDGVGVGISPGNLVTGYASPSAAPSGEGGSKIQYGIGVAGSNGDSGGKGGSVPGGGGGLASAVQSTNPFETYRTSISGIGSGYAYGDIDELFLIYIGRIMPLQNGATPIVTIVRSQGFPGGGGGGGGGGTVNGSNPARAGGGGGGGGSGSTAVSVLVFAWRIIGAGSINANGVNGGNGGNGGNAVTTSGASPAGGGGGGAAGSGGNGATAWVGYTYLDPAMTVQAKKGLKGGYGIGGTGVGSGGSNGDNGGVGLDGSDGMVRLYKFF